MLFFFELPVLSLDFVVWAELALVEDVLVLLLLAQEEKNATVARQTIAVRMFLFIIVGEKAEILHHEVKQQAFTSPSE